MTIRHILTCEYPPQPGGVSDYTHLLAGGLAAAGEEVHVWGPAADGPAPDQPDVTVHRDLGGFRLADLGRMDRALNAFPRPRRLLLQWVPHGYGWRAMNVPLCAWLGERGAGGCGRGHVPRDIPRVRRQLAAAGGGRRPPDHDGPLVASGATGLVCRPAPASPAQPVPPESPHALPLAAGPEQHSGGGGPRARRPCAPVAPVRPGC